MFDLFGSEMPLAARIFIAFLAVVDLRSDSRGR